MGVGGSTDLQEDHLSERLRQSIERERTLLGVGDQPFARLWKRIDAITAQLHSFRSAYDQRLSNTVAPHSGDAR